VVILDEHKNDGFSNKQSPMLFKKSLSDSNLLLKNLNESHSLNLENHVKDFTENLNPLE
jgi:hypothetical protein